MLAAAGAVAWGRTRKAPSPQASPDKRGEATPAALPEIADDLDRAIADLFEEAPAGVMAAKQIRPLVAAWFQARGLKLGKADEAKLWPRLGERFKRDPNNGRPRYFGLKPCPKPGLRLVEAHAT